MEEPGKTPHISRRNALKALLFGTGAGALYLMGTEGRDRLYVPIDELNKDWELAQSLAQLNDPQNLPREIRQQIAQVRLGCSFSPEQMDFLDVPTNPKVDVAFMRDELGMQDVRLSFRSNRILKANDTIDFQYYDAYVQEFLRQGFRICWNIDGFKVSRYPEHHFSKYLLQNISPPPPNTIVQLNDPLAQRVLAYNQLLYEALEKEYGLKSRVKRGDTIQGINEPFTPAGVERLIASPGFLAKNIKVLHDFFSDAHLIINSPGVPASPIPFSPTTFLEVNNFIEQMCKQDPSLRGRIIAGFDWYGLTPSSKKPPFAKRPLDMNAVVQLTEGSDIFQKQIERAQKGGFLIHGTEMQWEPWGSYTSPGNSLSEFIFALIRSLKVCDTSKPTLLSLWGVEHHIKHSVNPSKEHLAMREMIRQINKH